MQISRSHLQFMIQQVTVGSEFAFLTSSQVVLTLLFLSQTLRTPALDAYYCPYMWLRKLRLREVL